MSNSKLKILVSFLLLAFVFVVFPAKMTSADVVASGECGAQGNNLTWTFDNNGTLTISGSGKMINCTVTDGVISQPWLDYRKSIKTVVFEGEITSIGDYAFNGCENLTQITIPNGVDYLGEYSFAGCSSLESIEVPDGVKKIQTHAFALCHNLVSVTLHENLEEIGVSAFDDDQHIKELVIPSTVKKIYANTFHNTIGLECFTVCGPIEYKHAYSLKNFGAVKIVVLDSVTDLGVWNFSKDYNLRSLVINKETYDSASSKFPTKLTEDQIHFYYDVSYSNDGHGTVSGTTRTFGTDEVKLDITPERYYKLDQVIWTSGETTKTLTADENGNYIMPNVDAGTPGATIKATFKVKSHHITTITGTPATCEEAGVETHYKCTACNKLFSDPDGQHEISIADTVIPALGHDLEEKAAKDPTCTEDGHEKYYECKRCHKKFSDAEGTNEISAPEKTDKLGHDWDEGEVTTKPECEAEGTRTFHCKRDGCTHTKTEPIPAKGHSKEPEHHEAVPPTHENEGSHEYYECPDCHKKFSDPGCEHEMTDAQIVDPPIGAAELGEAAEDKDGRKYVVTDPHIGGAGTVTFTGVETPVENLIIPDTVVIKLETYKVTKIASKAFYNDKTLKTVVIGSNIVSIDSDAVYGCSNLSKIACGAMVITMGSMSFAR